MVVGSWLGSDAPTDLPSPTTPPLFNFRLPFENCYKTLFRLLGTIFF